MPIGLNYNLGPLPQDNPLQRFQRRLQQYASRIYMARRQGDAKEEVLARETLRDEVAAHPELAAALLLDYEMLCNNLAEELRGGIPHDRFPALKEECDG